MVVKRGRGPGGLSTVLSAVVRMDEQRHEQSPETTALFCSCRALFSALCPPTEGQGMHDQPIRGRVHIHSNKWRPGEAVWHRVPRLTRAGCLRLWRVLEMPSIDPLGARGPQNQYLQATFTPAPREVQ